MEPPKHKDLTNKKKVLVIGGSPQSCDEAILTALAVEAAGANLVHLYSCPKYLEVAKNSSLNFLLHSFPENPGYLSLYDVKKVQNIDADVIAIGSGIGNDFDAKKAMLAIVNSSKPIVISQNGLMPELLKIYNPDKHKWLLIMNYSEFENLFKVNVTEENLEAVAKRHKLNICVKGETDYILACNDFKIDSDCLVDNAVEIDREMLLHVTNGCINQMNVSIIGNILAGIISSYIGQGFSALQSMIVATNLLRLANERLARETESFSGKDLIDFYKKFTASNG